MFTSRTVAYLGAQAGEVAILVQAQRLTGSPLVVGTLGLAELVPLIVFGLYGGVLADRFHRRKLIVWCEPGLAACAGLLLVNSLLPHPPLWPLYVVAALMMGIASLQRPAFEAATPRVVPLEKLTQASAVMSVSTNASVLLGSSLGGALAAAPGPWLVYALNVAGYVVSFAMLRRLPALPPITPGAGGGHGRTAGRRWPGLAGARALGDPGRPAVRDKPARPARLLPGRPVGDDLRLPERDAAVPRGGTARAVVHRAAVRRAVGGRADRLGDRRLDAAHQAARPGHRRRRRVLGTRHGRGRRVPHALRRPVLPGGRRRRRRVQRIFRDTMWKQSIPDHLRGRMAGIELLSYAAGPPTGQLRSGAVAAVTSPRFSLTSGGLACVAAVAVVLAVLPAFRGYVAPVGAPATASPAGEPPLAWSLTNPGPRRRLRAPRAGRCIRAR